MYKLIPILNWILNLIFSPSYQNETKEKDKISENTFFGFSAYSLTTFGLTFSITLSLFYGWLLQQNSDLSWSWLTISIIIGFLSLIITDKSENALVSFLAGLSIVISSAMAIASIGGITGYDPYVRTFIGGGLAVFAVFPVLSTILFFNRLKDENLEIVITVILSIICFTLWIFSFPRFLSIMELTDNLTIWEYIYPIFAVGLVVLQLIKGQKIRKTFDNATDLTARVFLFFVLFPVSILFILPNKGKALTKEEVDKISKKFLKS